jgi:capsular polysaccharide transport system permease protein
MAQSNILREVGLEPSPLNPPVLSAGGRAEPLRVTRTIDSVTHVGAMAAPPSAAEMQAPRKDTRRRKSGFGLLVSALLFIGLPIAVATWFYSVVAANQFISEFKLSIRGPERGGEAPGASTGAIGPTVFDAFIVTELINSRQMVTDVSKAIDLRKIFSSSKGDFYYRLKLPATQEDLVDHWKKVVASHFDMLTGIVTVSVRSFSPEESLLVAQTIAKAADEAVFKMSERARQDLVRFADEDVKRAEGVLDRKRGALRDFRVKEQIMDATRTAASSSDLLGTLRAQLSQSRQEEATYLSSGLQASAPQVVAVRNRILSTQAQRI